MSDGPSLASVLTTHRAALLRQDAATLRLVLRSWQPVERRLLADLEAFLRGDIEPRLLRGESLEAGKIRTERRYRILLQQTREVIDSYAAGLLPRITAAQRMAVGMAVQHAGTLIGVGGVRVPVEATNDLIGFLSNSSPLREVLETFGPDAADRASQALVNGIASGQGVRVTAVQVRKALGTTVVRAMSVTRSATLGAYRSASLETYRQNSNLVSGWIWTAAKQTRTCLNCLARDGSFWALDKPMPAHVNCRCAMRPAVKDVSTAGVETGSAWFKKQTDDTKRSMMGPRAFEAYKAGRVDLMDFAGLRDGGRWGMQSYQRSLREVLAVRS